MNGAVLQEDGEFVIEELAMPIPAQGEVRIRVNYCGVCHSDLHVIRGDSMFPRPCVLGHEISGTIDAVGDAAEELEVGQAVVCSFIIPCGKCRACVSGNDELCIPCFQNFRRGTLFDGRTRHHRLDGTPLSMFSMGGLAEYCCVPTTDVFAVPNNLSLRDATIIGCSTLTAFGAVSNVANVGVGSTVAIIGVGGVGSSLLQLCQLAGAGPIIAIDVNEAKRSLALSLGATDFVNSQAEPVIDVVAEITNGTMVEVSFEALGLPATIVTAVQLLAEGGRAVVIGLPGKVKGVELDIGTLVRRRLSVMGSFGAHARSDMPKIVAAVAAGRLRSGDVISREFSFENVTNAYAELAAGNIVGRAVIAIRPSS